MPLNAPVSDSCLDQVFRNARTRNGWMERDVPDVLIRATYDLTRLGPTSANCSPARFLFLKSAAAKQRLIPHMSEGNKAKTLAAPWVAIVAWDWRFHEKIPDLFPHRPEMQANFEPEPKRLEHGFRNGTLQAAYMMIAARMMGLDCGPMSGFNAAGVEEEFFRNDETMRDWRVNFVCNIGYGDDTGLKPRLPRLSFHEACRVL